MLGAETGHHSENPAKQQSTFDPDQKYIDDYARRFMVVAGINSYASYATKEGSNFNLITPVADACRVYTTLMSDFGFEGQLLVAQDDARNCLERSKSTSIKIDTQIAGNGTRADILEAIFAIMMEATPVDLFLFYFGGHAIDSHSMGFILPYGVEAERYDTYLMYPELFGAIEAIPCLHKLCFFDCCFSGVLTRGQSVEYNGEILNPSGIGTDTSILLEPAMALFASTGASDLAPDQFHIWQDCTDQISSHSPFADTLITTLNGLRPGDALTGWQMGHALFSGVRRRVDRVLTRDGTGTQPLNPVTKIVGAAPIILRKPGLRWQCPASVCLHTGDQLSIDVGISEGIDNPYTINLCTPPPGVSLNQKTLILDGANLPEGESEIALEARCGSSVVLKKINVMLVSDQLNALKFEFYDLPPCFVNQDYRAAIRVSGGKLPYQWECRHLPSGLDMSKTGDIYGRLRAAQAIAGGYLREFVVTVIDASGIQVKERFAIPIIDPDVYASIPAGEFHYGYIPNRNRAETLLEMGISRNQKDRLASSHIPGKMPLPRYFIRRRPVTLYQWKEFVEATGYSGLPQHWQPPQKNGFWTQNGNLPVTGLTGGDVEKFCEWRGTRLPNRFEWEKAARGSDGRLFPWGDTFSEHACNCPEQHGKIYNRQTIIDHFDKFLARVDQFPHASSPYGVEDMVGNAWELTGHIMTDRDETIFLPRRGGSIADGGAHLATCFGCDIKNAVKGKANKREPRIAPKPGLLPPLTSFRDVIDLAVAPPYGQNFVKIPALGMKMDWDSDIFLPCDIYIASYQVSNTEYAEFIRATNHRRPPHWQSEDSWFFPFRLRFHPVVGVSYNDVMAFCEWKSDQLQINCRPLIRSIWRAAVHAPAVLDSNSKPQPFPWGTNYHSGYCNHLGSGFGGTVPVFDLPQGRSAGGAWNLVGNAAEWVSEKAAAGGSWLRAIQNPAHFIAEGVSAGLDVGFRYYTYEDPFMAEFKHKEESDNSPDACAAPDW